MTTEEIINDMRSHTITSMRAAADRLEELSKQLEVAKKDVQALSRELGEFKGWYQPHRPEHVRKDPSRLEIAVMLKAGWFANRDADFNATDHKWWIEQADALIAAAKEEK